MDCNRDEATRAKEIAEGKLLEKDIQGAKRFALKAQSLFPALEGLSQFIAVIDMHLSSERKINGEPDYYGVLRVDPFVNEDILKKQYRRMALMLHPDKNRSVGAEEAFKILSEAYRILSDMDKRNHYNFKLNLWNQMSSTTEQPSVATTSQQYVPTWPAGAATSQYNAYGTQYTCFNQQWTQPASAFGASGSLNTPEPSHHGRSTPVSGASVFAAHWTGGVPPIPVFQMQSPTTMGCNLVPTSGDSSCLGPSLQNQSAPSRRSRKAQAQNAAAETAEDCASPSPSVQQQSAPGPSQVRSSRSTAESFWTLCSLCMIYFEYHVQYLKKTLLCPRCERPFLAKAVPAPKRKIKSSEHTGSVPQQQQDMPAPSNVAGSMPAMSTGATTENVKQMHEEAVDTTVEREAQTHCTNTVSENVETASAQNDAKENLAKRKRAGKSNDAAQPAASGRPGLKKNSENLEVNARESSGQLNFKQLSLTVMQQLLMTRAKSGLTNRLKESKTDKKVNEVDAINSMAKKSSRAYSDVKPCKSTLEETDVLEAIQEETKAMAVPDANFHNFDEDRVEDSFLDNEVWAAYDNDDGMPRYYALVQHVISKVPFMVQICWLNSRSTSEFGSNDWIDSGFTKTVGGFRPTKPVTINRLNSFSHRVNWKKGPRGVYQIFPCKGDVWALYRNWSPDWNEDTTDEMKHEYDVVVVLEDYHEDNGVLVAHLVKVAGFTSVFDQLFKVEASWTISKREMFRFSHQVPFFQLNGLEDTNAPEGSYELDTAALPLDLLRVITNDEAAEERAMKLHAMRRRSRDRDENRAAKERGPSEHDKPLRVYTRRKKSATNE